MKSSFLRKRIGGCPVLGIILGLAWLLPSTVLAPLAPPAWWASRGATNNNPPDDYAAANIGQLKRFASKAIDELDAKLLPAGAGTKLHSLLTTWQQPPAAGVTRDDFAVLTVGQLKAVAKPFYDRLRMAKLVLPYPWSSTIADDDDFAVANLGQLKTVFALNVPQTWSNDSDGDGIPDFWEVAHGFDPTDPSNAFVDTDGDGLTNAEEFALGTDPRDYDTDDDATADGIDAYPLDNRRSRGLPSFQYAQIDITDPAIGTNRVGDAAIDDTGQYAYYWIEAENELIQVRGKDAEGTLRASSVPLIAHEGQVKPVPNSDPPIDALIYMTWTYEPKMINASAQLALTAFAYASVYFRDPDYDPNDPNYPQGPDAAHPAYRFAGPRARTVMQLASTGNLPEPRADFTGNGARIAFPDTGGSEVVQGITSTGVLWGSTPLDDQQYLESSSIGSTRFGIDDTPFFEITAVSGVTIRLGSGNVDQLVGMGNLFAESERDTFIGETGWSPIQGFFQPYDDAKLFAAHGALGVVGFSSHFTGLSQHADATVRHPFVCSPSNTKSDFYSLLPASRRSHVGFTAPETEMDFSDSGNVVFTAGIADHDEANQKVWTPGTLFLDRSSYDPEAGEIGILRTLDLPQDYTWPEHRLGGVPDGGGIAPDGGIAPALIGMKNVRVLDDDGFPIDVPHAFLLPAFEVEYLSRHPVPEPQILTQLPGGYLYESDPIPRVELTCLSAIIDAATGELAISVHCEIRDYASSLQRSGAGRLNELKFIVDGEIVETLNVLGAYAQPDVVPIWQPYGKSIAVERTFIIPRSHAGVHTVVGLTGENPSARQGWDSVGVSVGFNDSGKPIVLSHDSRPLHTPPPVALSPVVCRILTTAAIANWLTRPDAPEFRLAGREVTMTRSDSVGAVDGERIPPDMVALYVADPDNPIGDPADPRVFFFSENSSDLAWAAGRESWDLEVRWFPEGEWETLDDRQVIQLMPNERMGGEQAAPAAMTGGPAPGAGGDGEASGDRSLFTPQSGAANPSAPAAQAPAVAWGYNEFFLFLEIIYGSVERKIAENFKDSDMLAIIPVGANGGIEVEHNRPDDPLPLLIKVDSGFKTPADAAIAFHEAIKGRWITKINYHQLRVEAAGSIPNGDFELATETERFNQGFTEFASTLTVAIAENYIRLIPYTGGGIVLDINEGFEQWQQGNKKTVAAVSAVTFIGAVVSHRLMAGKPVHFKGNGVDEVLEGEAGIAIGGALQKGLLQGKKGLLGRVEVMREFEQRVAEGKVAPELMEKLLRGGFFSREHWSQFPDVDPTPGFFSRLFLRKKFEPYDVLGFGILKAEGKIPLDAPFEPDKAWNQFRKFFTAIP